MNKFRNLKAANQKDWLWKPDQGEPIAPRDMTTGHLVNAYRMLKYNTEDQIPKKLNVSIWPGIRNWNPAYIKRAKKEFVQELRKRKDISEEQLFTELL